MRRTMRMSQSGRRRLTIAVGATILAFGAIVLARAQTFALGAPTQPPPIGGPAPVGPGTTRIDVHTDELTGFVALTQGAVLANGVREVFGEVRIEASANGGVTQRRPVALAVVLDTSGSMMGEKIDSAVAALHQLIGRMHADDRVSVVVYNHEAHVLTSNLTPAAALELLRSSGYALGAAGGTNIPAGLRLGMAELERAPADMSRRLVLISDGLDGSGEPLAMVSSDVQRRAQGAMTTSALGVGADYAEDWLTTVADAGRGNYAFLAQGAALTSFLQRELEQAATTVAEGTRLDLALPPGWRVANAYGAQMDGATLPLGSLFASERRRVTLRFEVDAGAPGATVAMPVALRYVAARDRMNRNLDLGRLSVAVVNDPSAVAASQDATLHAEAVAAHVDASQALAVTAWREGRTEEAARISDGNLVRLRELRRAAPAAAPMIDQRVQATTADLDNFHSLDSSSAAGRAWGLSSNCDRRQRAEAF
ncbi:MAG: VWA domain-containing protein [Sandaracinaceae bacterium]